MPRFAKAATQAHKAAKHLAAHGTPRTASREHGAVSSLGTERSYRQSLTGFAQHLKDHRAGDLYGASPDQARAWLAARAQSVGQTTLDRDRQALNAWYAHRGTPLGAARAAHQSVVTRRGLADQSRHYTRGQITAIAAAQTPRNALATTVAREAGLRAAELATLARAAEQPADVRAWRADRFIGRDAGVRYTVIGKGGLVREVALSRATAERLEAQRLATPTAVRDREIDRVQRYAIGHGQAWSQSFSDASRRTLGWSAGAHAVRHSYAQDRLEQIQQQGYGYEPAREIVAQELGHFRDQTTETYLR